MNANLQLRKLEETLRVTNNKDVIYPQDIQIRDMINDCIETIEDLKTENDVLRNLLYKIRRESRKCDLTCDDLIYRPIRNTTKQEVYESYKKIKNMIMGEYEFLSNENAIDEIIKCEKEYKTWI